MTSGKSLYYLVNAARLEDGRVVCFSVTICFQKLEEKKGPRCQHLGGREDHVDIFVHFCSLFSYVISLLFLMLLSWNNLYYHRTVLTCSLLKPPRTSTHCFRLQNLLSVTKWCFSIKGDVTTNTFQLFQQTETLVCLWPSTVECVTEVK